MPDTFNKTMSYPEGYKPDEIIGKCGCGSDITRGEYDASGICTDCWCREDDELVFTEKGDELLEELFGTGKK